MDSSEDVVEGFLCPICMRDFGGPSQLSLHFEQAHADDKAILNQLRSVFGKAKKKILGRDEGAVVSRYGSGEPVRQVSRGTPATGGIDVDLWEPQSLGVWKSHSAEFQSIRKSKIERYVVETNKILIRLGKLLKSGVYTSDSTLPNAIKAKKDMERSVVPWESDSEAKICRHCMKKFSMLNRKHHCRLCGLVMCGNDSGFISPTKACDLLGINAAAYVAPERSEGSPGEDEEKNDIRVCVSCAELLNRHQKLSKEKNMNTAIVQLYERLQVSMADADALYPTFVQMADSIGAGEVEYRLDYATETRFKLLKCFESVDDLSKKIQFFGSESEKPLSFGIQKLQRSIRVFAANYLQEKMFTMPGLPTEAEFLELRRKREAAFAREKQERRERLMQERLLNSPSLATKNEKVTSSSSTRELSPKASRKVHDESELSRSGSTRSKFWKKEGKPLFSAVSISKNPKSSWGPVQVTVSSSPDPMVQQMEIVKNYIVQAKQDKRYDEVELFQRNLKELEMAYMNERRDR